MPAQDTSALKEKIILFFRRKGPSLPVHISKEVGLSILFTSAFLSELLSERKLKISNMRVGSSPIYFIPGQEPQLERFSQHLNNKEREAFTTLKENKFLHDSSQDPAIRVALRSIKDFAIPFRKPGTEDIFWRFFTVSEREFSPQEPTKPKIQNIPEIKNILTFKEKEIKSEPAITIKKEIKHLEIFDKKLEKTEKLNKTDKIKEKRKPLRVKTNNKKNDKFFNKVKEWLSKKQIEILDLVSFSKEDIVLKVRLNEKEHLLIAYNKKKINELDIIKAYKKSSERGMPYFIISLGEVPKKLNEFLEAASNLSGIEKLN